MDREPVSSTNVASIGYDYDTQTLEVEFHSGGIYQYDNVPPNIFFDLQNAPSKGQYLYRFVIQVYPFRKIS